MKRMLNPLVLDFDAAVHALPGEQRIALSDWQEAIRFGCRMKTLRALKAALAPQLDALQGPAFPIFIGSGDYHHVSYLLIERLRHLREPLREPLRVVVFDNHPDNMRYPFGIHCGSWVWHVSRLPHVASVEVLGITSSDVEAGHAWENHLRPLRQNKVRYGCVGRDVGLLQKLGGRGANSYASTTELLDAFTATLDASSAPIYLSIDKDVLSPQDVHTNWDQGTMRWSELGAVIEQLRERLVGCDVTGDVSVYRYQSRFKRFLSGLDQQPDIPARQLSDWQRDQHTLNLDLLRRLAR